MDQTVRTNWSLYMKFNRPNSSKLHPWKAHPPSTPYSQTFHQKTHPHGTWIQSQRNYPSVRHFAFALPLKEASPTFNVHPLPPPPPPSVYPAGLAHALSPTWCACAGTFVPVGRGASMRVFTVDGGEGFE